MAGIQYLVSSPRAGLGSVVVTRDSASTKAYLISNVGVMSAVNVPSAAQMDGAASAAFTGVGRAGGSVRMDGVAAAAFSGTLLARQGAAKADGAGAAAFTGFSRYPGAAQMDGRTSMVVGQSTPGAGISEMGGAASMIAVAPNTHNMVVSEKFISGDVISNRMQFVKVLQEIASILTDRPTAQTRYHHALTTPIRVQPALAPAWSAVLGLVQNVLAHDVASPRFIWGRTLKEVFKVSAAANAGGVYRKILTQLFTLGDIEGLRHTIPAALSQSIHLSLSLAGGLGLKLLQKFLMATASAPVFHYHLALAGRIVVGGILGHFTRAVLTQLFTVHADLHRQFVANGSLAQLLTVHPALNSKLVLQIVGDLHVSSSQLVHMLYRGDPLLDGVAITALFVSPSGTTTAWAVNTRTGAVTEYLNYDFRSFAWMGNRYIAAGAEGLYELDGDTDDGEAIISELMGGYLQLNEKKLFGIKGAYVAIRGGGRFYLKLIAGDGREYVYELRAQPNLMTTKVRIGKGIRTTYLAFDLVTEGQDFDLDSIEFIPMTSGRRV